MTLRELYNRFVSTPARDRLLRDLFGGAVDSLAHLRGFHFPPQYIWRQKLEMLTARYEPESVAVFKTLILPGMTVIDLGAHIGYFTRLFAKLASTKGRVLAFEADPFIFKLLQANTSRLSNVSAWQTAVGDRTGLIDFYHSEEKSGCGSVVEILPVSFKKKKLSVPVIDLDSALQSAGIERIDVIKMDIEGGEPKALLGMQRTLERNPAIILITEFAPEWLRAGGMDPLHFLKMLKDFGFGIDAIIGGSLVPFDPKSEDEMRSSMPSYFINICCRRT